METFSALLAICAGNSPVPGEFPAQRPVTGSFDVFFDLRLNKRLSKQSWGWCFETLSRLLSSVTSSWSLLWKFNSLYALLADLADKGPYLNAICLQESWLAVNSDISLLKIPNHKMFQQGRSRCSHRVAYKSYTLLLSCRRYNIVQGSLGDP